MDFIIIEKTRLTFPALISKVFSSSKEAKEYGYKKPAKDQAKVLKVENGFELIEKTSLIPTHEASTSKRKIDTGKVTLFLKDLHGYCKVMIF